jgi:hypothetical protein
LTREKWTFSELTMEFANAGHVRFAGPEDQSRGARLLDNLPDVSLLLRCVGWVSATKLMG